jgi:hypothetical protein
MFRKRKKKTASRLATDDPEDVSTMHLNHCKVLFKQRFFSYNIDSQIDPMPIQLESKRVHKIEDEEPDFLSSIPKPTMPKKVKHKLKTQIISFDQPKKVDLKALKSKLVNTDAVASVQDPDAIRNSSVLQEERYSYENMQKLMDSQVQQNRSVCDTLQQTVEDDNDDGEYEEEELKKMQGIKEIRQRKKMVQGGLPMNTQKEEFLGQKDVQMAEAGIQELKYGIEAQDLFPHNGASEMVLDDYGDGEDWILNQISNALGSDHVNQEASLLTLYKSDKSPSDFIETKEMREIKYTMLKEIDDYTTDLEMEISSLQQSIEDNKAAIQIVEKGISEQKLNIEEVDTFISEQTPSFKEILEFNELLEELTVIWDVKEDDINNVFYNLKNAEIQFQENLENMQRLEEDLDMEKFRQQPFGNRRKGLGFSKQKPSIELSGDRTANSVRVLKEEFSKDIEAAKSTLSDAISSINSGYLTPDLLFTHIENYYSK